MTESEIIEAPAITDAVWRDRAYRALESMGEMVAVYYMAYGAGWTEWHLLHTRQELDALLAAGSRRSAFHLYLSPQLPLRGVADDLLEEAVLQCLRLTGEVLLASKSVRPRSTLPTLPTCLSHMGADEEADIRDWFSEHRGGAVLAGPHPGALPTGHEQILSGRVPDPDGRVRRAAF